MPLLGVSFLGFALIGLDRSPPIGVEEVSQANPAYELAFHGRMAFTVLQGSIEAGEAYFLQPPGHVLVMAGVYRAAGFGLWQTRVSVLIFGALGVVAVALFTRRLTGSALAGVIAGLVLWGDASWLFVIRNVKLTHPLGIVLAIAMLSVVLGPRQDGRSERVLLAVSGLLGGLALMSAPRVVFLVAVAALLAASRVPSGAPLRYRIKPLAIFCLSASVPIAAWGLYVLSDTDAFAAQFLPHVAGGASGGLGNPLGSLWAAAMRLLPLIPLVIAVAVMGRGSAPWDPAQRRLLIWLLAGSTLVVVLADWRLWYLTPFIAVAVGGLAVGALGARSHRPAVVPVALVGLVLAAALAAPVARLFVTFTQWESRDPGTLAAQFESMTTPNCTVAGPAFIYYSAHNQGCTFRFNRFTLAFPNEETYQMEYRETLAEWAPDYFVLRYPQELSDMLPERAVHRYSLVGEIGTERHEVPFLNVLDRFFGTGNPYRGQVYSGIAPAPTTLGGG